MKEWYPIKNPTVWCPDPTWPTHRGISTRAGYEWKNYRYYDRKARGFDLNGMLEDLDKAQNGDIVILHVCAHNPTGCDPSHADWAKILEVCKRKQHFCLFDSAY